MTKITLIIDKICYRQLHTDSIALVSDKKSVVLSHKVQNQLDTELNTNGLT